MNKVSDFFKSFILIVPTISFLMTTFYYYVFFIPFDNFDQNILSISDYFNKAANLFGLAIFSTLLSILVGLIFGMIAGGKDVAETSRLEKFFLTAILPIYFLALILIIPQTYWPIFSIFSLTLAVPLFASLVTKLSTETDSKKETILSELFQEVFQNTRFLAFILFTSLLMTFVQAHRDSNSFSQPKSAKFVQVLSNGYLIGENGELTLHDSKMSIVAKDRYSYKYPPQIRICNLTKKLPKICKQ